MVEMRRLWRLIMRSQRGPRGQFSSLYGTSTLRLGAEFPYPRGGPRYERASCFDADGQLIVPVNEWYRPHGGRRCGANA